jgi:hypothetical protein
VLLAHLIPSKEPECGRLRQARGAATGAASINSLELTRSGERQRVRVGCSEWGWGPASAN